MVGYNEFGDLTQRVAIIEQRLKVLKDPIVINTPLVQYRVSETTINCMLLGGHKFELTFEELEEIYTASKIKTFKP